MILKNKVVIVSGIGPGLGIKLALEAAREGARLVIAARTLATLQDARRSVEQSVPDAQLVLQTSDITDREQCRLLVQRAEAQFGRVDALINSAVFHGGFESVEQADLGDWRKAFDTNVLGTMNLTLEAVHAMKRAGGGAVVMINTMAVRKPFPSEAGYAASKGGLAVAAKYLAQELGRYNIRVNTVYPGWMWGAPVQNFVKREAQARQCSEQDVIDQIAINIPLGRIVCDSECARAALFLASDYASAITGANLDCNGGEFIGL